MSNSSENKTVQVLVDYFYPATGGLAFHCLRVYEILRRRGWRVSVQTTKSTTEEKNVLPEFSRVAGIEVHRYSYENYNFNPLALKLDYRDSDVVCLNELIILPHYFVYLYAYILSLIKRKNFAVVLTSHGLFTTNIEVYHSFKRRIKRFVDRTLGVFLINHTVDRVHSISQREKNGLVKAGVRPELIEVVANGLDREAFMDSEALASAEAKQLASGFGCYLLQIGRLDRHKNYEAAIKALTLVPRHINYVILGPDQDDTYKRELILLAQKLGVADRVLFAGVIKGVDKFYLLRHALAYIHMAHSEGFGMVVQEAMSQGAVCLVSKGTGLEELILDGVNGYVIDREDTEEIAEKIRFLANHPAAAELEAIRKNNISSVKNRTWDKVASCMETLFEKAINHNLQNSYDRTL